MIACGDAAEVLQLGEEPLDKIALAVEPLAGAGLPAPVALGRDVRVGTLLLNQLTDAVGIAGLVRRHDGARAKMVKQWVGDLPVTRLSCRPAEPDREALRVDNHTDLGREPAACSTKTMICTPLFAVAAC